MRTPRLTAALLAFLASSFTLMLALSPAFLSSASPAASLDRSALPARAAEVARLSADSARTATPPGRGAGCPRPQRSLEGPSRPGCHQRG